MSNRVPKKPARSLRNGQITLADSDSMRFRSTRLGKKIENHDFNETGSGLCS